ncbi:hypothetical protein ACFE04_022960 [Oxalis oulophora]
MCVSFELCALNVDLVLAWNVGAAENKLSSGNTSTLNPSSHVSVHTPTTLEHIVFGIASNVKSWPSSKQLISLWWKPQQMRGCVFLDSLSDEDAHADNKTSRDILHVGGCHVPGLKDEPAPVGSVQTVCYDRWFSWTISVSWGYAVQVFGNHIFLGDVLPVQETFMPWKSEPLLSRVFTFDIRNIQDDPCRRPTIFYFDGVDSSRNDRCRKSIHVVS